MPAPKLDRRSRSKRFGDASSSSDYCFFVIGVTGCDPPVDLGPGVTPALFSSVESLEVLAAVELGFGLLVFGLAPAVGPLPASLVDAAPFVGPLPASIFDCANAGAERPIATAAASKVVADEDMTISFDKTFVESTRIDAPSSAGSRDVPESLPSARRRFCVSTRKNNALSSAHATPRCPRAMPAPSADRRARARPTRP
jgi:hypothetical protein